MSDQEERDEEYRKERWVTRGRTAHEHPCCCEYCTGELRDEAEPEEESETCPECGGPSIDGSLCGECRAVSLNECRLCGDTLYDNERFRANQPTGLCYDCDPD